MKTMNTVSIKPADIYSRPRITKGGIGIVVIVWFVFTLLAAFPLVQYYHVPFLRALYWQIFQSCMMLVLGISIWFITIRWMYTAKWYWKGLVHLVVAPGYAVVNNRYLYDLIVWFGNGDKSNVEPLSRGSGWLIYFSLVIYAVQVSIFHAYEILRKLRLRERTALELMALQREQELAALKAQINPHFLFNTLNSISAMASTDPEETRTMIAQLADMLRYVLESSEKDLVPLKHEIRFIQDYIALESRRMEDRLKTDFQIDQSLYSCLVPPMILQPLVENAIRHGISPLEDGGEVRIQIQRRQNEIVFQVANTGARFECENPLTNADGVGLKNTDVRLRILYGDSAALKILTFDQGGCHVIFNLPIK